MPDSTSASSSSTGDGHIHDGRADLQAGADDYLTKPFSSKESVARLEASLRHRGSILDPDHSARAQIESVRGFGYRFSGPG